MAGVTSSSTSPTDAERDLYPEWEAAMADYENEYGWDAHDVTTEDGYKLTLFKVFKRNYTGETDAVLFQQGYSQDATSVFEAMNAYYPGEKHHWFKVIDEGYDIWFNNFRGTRYSLEHTNPAIDYTTQKYWNFSFDKLGIYDAKAAIDEVYNQNGGKKI